MHPVSLFDELMGRPGPKKRRLQRSMDAIGAAGAGVIVLLMRPLPGSAAAEAAPPPSGGMDLRTYGIGAQILPAPGVHAMELTKPTHSTPVGPIRRASGRDRVVQYVWNRVSAGSLKKKKKR